MYNHTRHADALVTVSLRQGYRGALRSLQPLVIITGQVSVVSFIAIAWSVGGYNDSVRKVVIVDIIAIVALAFAGVIHVVSRNQS